MVKHRNRLGIEEGTLLAASGEPDAGQRARLDQIPPLFHGWRAGKEGGFFALPFDQAQVADARAWGARIQRRASRLVVLGIGGSSLGARTLVSALAPARGMPVLFHDNVDPTTLADLYRLDWRETFLLVVSKSGGTAETLCQFLTLLPHLTRVKGFRQRVLVITDPTRGALGGIARALELPILSHPAVGGRYSVLSVVGMVPAAAAGVKVERVAAGAAAMAGRCLAPGFADNPALRHGWAQWRQAGAGRNVSVFFVYGDRLGMIPDWRGQLWAESLGKRNPDGAAFGMTPVQARGAVDQHSQVQLYLEGPSDKQFTFLFDPSLGEKGRVVPGRFRQFPEVAPLVGRKSGALLEAEFRGTRDAILHHGAPGRTFLLEAGDGFALGELLFLLMAETVVAGRLAGVDPFDQPAVEEGKRRALAWLARKG